MSVIEAEATVNEQNLFSDLALTGSLAKVYVGMKIDSMKYRLAESRIGKFFARQFAKIDRIVTKPTVVKIATAIVGMETVAGLFTCIGTATFFFAMGQPLLAIAAIVAYLISTSVRYIIARNAMNVK